MHDVLFQEKRLSFSGDFARSRTGPARELPMSTPANPVLPLRAWLSLAFAGIVLSALWLVGITPVDFVYAVFWPAAVLVLLIAVSAPWRAIPLIKIRTMMIAGMTVVPLLAFILVGLNNFLSGIIPSGTFFNDISSSFLIEVLLIAPVILLLSGTSRGAWITFTGPLDAALLGAGCGAGFEIVENLVRSVPWGNTPEWYTGSAYSLWAGHGAVTTFAGLMVGYGLMVRHRTRFWWLLPGLGLLWAGTEHYFTISNAAGSDNILLSLISQGWLFLLVFIVAFILSLYLSGRTLRWYLERDTSAKTEENFPAVLFSSRNAPAGRFAKIAAYEKFRRVRQAAAWGFRHYDQGSVTKDMESHLGLIYLRSHMKILHEGLAGPR